jgi:pimeloyl-ACP methyl ester carboxylesterase
MGLATQMIAWHEGLCRLLAERGYRVIRFDNRDIGRSTKLDWAGAPSRVDLLLGRRATAPYLLRDMAKDAVELLDHLEIDQAHVVGASMGGIIAQTMAISAPERVLTLTSMMSSTGESAYGRPSPQAQAVLFGPRPADRAGYVAAAEKELVWASKRYGDAAVLRELAAASYDRAYRPAGIGRQLGAMILSGSRADALRELRVPTLVIHGLDDTLIDPSGGRRTAELVPGAELLLVPDMGHDRPRELWPTLIDALAAHTG